MQPSNDISDDSRNLMEFQLTRVRVCEREKERFYLIIEVAKRVLSRIVEDREWEVD